MSQHNAWIKSDEVVLAAARLAQDIGCANIGKNLYDAALRDAVRELCYDTDFDERNVEMSIPSDRIITLPSPMGGILNVFLYQGDHCDTTACTPCHHKPNYSHHGGDGSFANQQGVNIDPLQGNTFYFGEPNNLYYYGIIMSTMYLSPQCSQFSGIRIEYAGLGQDDPCVMPAVPTWAKEALMYKVAHFACMMRVSENPGLFGSLANRYDVELKNTRGAWVTALMRYKSLSRAERRDVNIYNTKIGGWEPTISM